MKLFVSPAFNGLVVSAVLFRQLGILLDALERVFRVPENVTPKMVKRVKLKRANRRT